MGLPSPIGFPLRLARLLKRYLVRQWAVYEVIVRYPDAQFDSGVEIRVPSRLKLGKRVVVWGGTLLDCGGARWCNYQGGIALADDVEIGNGCILLGPGEIEIGRAVEIGPWSMVASSGIDYSIEHAKRARPKHWFRKVVVGDFARTGARVTILPGVTVGEGAVIGTGAVVTKDVPPYAIVAGVPARVIGERKDYSPPPPRAEAESS